MAEGDPESQQFVEEELGFCLRDEDHEHIRGCRDCLTDLDEIEQGLSETFTLFPHHSADSNESSPETCETESERQESEELLPSALKTNVLHGKLSTIRQIMQYRICDWNTVEHASQVYNALKVNAYIVRPNYFLSASLYTRAVSQLNMDEFFKTVNGVRKKCCWSIFEHKFDAFLDAFDFDGCEDLADGMFQRDNRLKKLLSKLEALGKTVAYSHVVEQSLELIKEGLKKGKVTENLSLEYVLALFEFFKTTTWSADFGLYVRSQFPMSLEFKDIEPRQFNLDFHATCHKNPFLVGQFQRFEENRAENIPKQDLQQSDALNELSKELEEKLKVGCSRLDKPKEPNDARENAGGAHNEKSEESSGYRKISTVELHKVSRYLPQLLGGMLATMEKHGGHQIIASALTVAYPKRNNTVQLGFTVEGFKLRFVRLVLCRHKYSDAKPTVEDVRKPGVKCEVFITEEINLFHKQHLKLFFKYLFAFASIFQYECQ